MKRKHMPGCTCCGCSVLCGGIPNLCGIEIETPINTETITWDVSDITWVERPSKASIPRYIPSGPETGHPFNSDADWEVCYFAELPSSGSNFSDTANVIDYPFSEFTCGATHSGTLTITEQRTWRPLGVTYIAIHRNIVTGAFDLSISVHMDLIYNSGATLVWDRDGIRVTGLTYPGRSAGVGDSQKATYRYGWHQSSISSCSDLFTEKSISAASPGTMTDFDSSPLDVNWFSSTCSAPIRIRFTDLSRVGTNIFILRALPVITAPTINFTLTECP